MSAGTVAAPHRFELAEFGEDFEVYRSGAAVTLLCLKCKASNAMVGRVTMAALVEEAADHADTCPGRGA